ncbi:hypothetical protein NMG60_11022806 [Bertholletia excelsa]
MADDWDLHAVVRGCTAAAAPTTSSSTSAVFVSGGGLDFLPSPSDQFFFFTDPIESTSRNRVEDLQDLFKPFVPKLTPFLPPQITRSTTFDGLQDPSSSAPAQQQQQRQQPKQSGSASSATHAPSPRSKRSRKNQMKRVCHVPAEGLSSDMWSWRKYGQKPIKGSPYPRGYYRCSTTKGCLARKQVERNRSDPGMFIVTYTGEHNHPMPTHRNSLAGSTRQKPAAAPGDPSKPSSSSPPASPAASLSPATEKTDNREEREDFPDDIEDDEFGVSDMAVGDDFFEGLEDLAGPGDCFSEHHPASLPFPWLANSATTTAAGGG